MEQFNEHMETETSETHEPEDEDHEDEKSNRNELNGETRENEEEVPAGDEDDIINFNEDLLCEHKGLKVPNSKKKLVPQEAWDILKQYFPNCKEYTLDSSNCKTCEVSIDEILDLIFLLICWLIDDSAIVKSQSFHYSKQIIHFVH